MEAKYNTRSPAVKRLMKEAAELSVATADYQAAPLEENLFEWHFTVRGPGDTDFQGGVYHGRLLLPAEYPMKPPDIIMLTPNGRFEVGKKICLSISGHHPETWQPSWSIRTALLAIIGFMPSPAQGMIGSLDYTPEERKILAKKSQSWRCPTCGPACSLLAPPGQEEAPGQAQEVKEIVESLQMKGEEVKVQPAAAAAAAAPIASTTTTSMDATSAVDASTGAGASAAAPATPGVAAAPATPAANFSSAAGLGAGAAQAPRPRRARAAPARHAPAPQQESRGVQQVYDFCIMLLVAAIAALLYRRIGIMQDGEDSSTGLPDN